MMGSCRTYVAVGAVMIVTWSAMGEAQTRTSEADLIRSRQNISAVEGALERAISAGAQLVIEQVRAAMPGRWRLTSIPRASGARLPGQGVIFFVQVPDLQPPLMLELRQRTQQPTDRDLMALQRYRTALSTVQGPQRDELERIIVELEQQIDSGNARTTVPRQGSVSALSIVPSAPQGSPAGADPSVVADPDDAYTREVKGALMDVMLKQTQVLSVGPDEWMTIVARTSAAPDPLLPADFVDLSTWVMRVKGSTLSAFRAREITEPDALKLIEVLEQ